MIEAEVVLEGDSGQRLVFFADADAFFGLDGLMEAVGPAAARHEAAGKSIDDDDIAVLDHIVHIALVESMGLDGRLDVVLEVPVFGVGDVADAEQLLDRLPTAVGDADGALLLIDDVVTGEGFDFALFDLLAQLQLGNDFASPRILIGGLVGWGRR